MREIENTGMHKCKIMTLSTTMIMEKKVKGNERTPVMSDEDDIDGWSS